MMAGTFGNKIVSTKMEMLTELKQNLQLFVDSSNEVLELAATWVSNDDATKTFTFTEINKMIDDKLAYLGSADFSVCCGKANTEHVSSEASLPQASTSIDELNEMMSVRCVPISDELKSIMDQVKAMQNDICFLNANLDKLSEKQLTTETSVESLSDKYAKTEDEKISEIKAELKSIFEKQETLINQNSVLEDLENKIGALTKTQSDLNGQCLQQQSKMENCELNIQTLSDAQSGIVENNQQQQRKMDNCEIKIQNLSDAQSGIEENNQQQQSKIENCEMKIQTLSDAQSGITENNQQQQRKMENCEMKIQTLSDVQSRLKENNQQQQRKMENCEMKIQTLSDAQSEITENNQQQQRKMDDHKFENEELRKKSSHFLQFLSDSKESIEELKTRIDVLEDQSVGAPQMNALESRVKLLETDLRDFTSKFEVHLSSMEEIAQKNEEAFQNLSSGQEKDFKDLRKFEKRITDLEANFKLTSYETEKLYEDMDTKYEMVCRIVADRLAPVERLKNIFNERLISRNDNSIKLKKVCDQMAALQPKFSKLQSQKLKHHEPVVFSGCTDHLFKPEKSSIIKFPVIVNIGLHYDVRTGEFTAPLDGMYAVSLAVKISGIGSLCLAVRRSPCKCIGRWCRKCPVANVIRERNSDSHVSLFAVADIRAGEKLSVKCFNIDTDVDYLYYATFSCFRIN